MRNVLSFLLMTTLLATNIATAQEVEPYYTGYSQYEPGYIGNLLADKVNVRKTPSAKGEVLTTLPIGTDLEVKEVSDQTYAANGHQSPWYLVDFTHDGKKQSGYVWGGLISEVGAPSEDNQLPEGLEFVYGIEKITEQKVKTTFEGEVIEETNHTILLQVRAVLNGKELSKITFESPSVITSTNNLTIYGNKGIDGIKNVLQFQFSGNACGVPSGDVYVFWDGTRLQHVRTTDSFADAPIYVIESLVFPNEEGGKKGKILLQTISANEEGEEKTKTETYTWTGSTLKKG